MTPLIRTPDQRLRVFVSSTLQELADERVATKEAIQRIRLTPVMFEMGARPHPPRDLYRAYLAQSDVFIGIYWQRHGGGSRRTKRSRASRTSTCSPSRCPSSSASSMRTRVKAG